MNSKHVWQILKAAPAVLGMSLLVANSSLAAESSKAQAGTESNADLSLEVGSSVEVADQTLSGGSASETQILEQINRYSNEGNSLDQVDSVFQFRDVSPGDWAFEALRSLVERYGCIAGYPDGTYRGNRTLTRYEFAASLNACLQQIERLIATQGVTRQDLETLQRLLQEFEAELATLGTQVDNLEGRVAFVEDNLFSTTTKLNGEVVFLLSSVFGEEAVGGGEIEENETLVFQNRVRLNFDTSFTGEDRLRTRLEAENIEGSEGISNTNMTRLNLRGDNKNQFEIEKLWYRFPVGENITLHVATTGLDIDDVFDPINPTASSGGGALSRFGDRNPFTHRFSGSGVGAGANIALSENLSFDLIYLAAEGNQRGASSGIIQGDFATGAQLNFAVGDRADLGLTYVYSYQGRDSVNLDGSTSTPLANAPFVDINGNEVPTTAHRLGLQGAFQLSERFILGGFFGYAFANAEGSGLDDASAELLTGSVNLSILDVGKEGAAIVLIAGVPPRVQSFDNKAENFGFQDDEDTSVLIEAQYKYPLNDNIEITPGAYVVLNPEHNANNDAIFVGAIRTRFRF